MGIARKLLQLVITVILVTLFASFLLELLPGDPVEVLVPFGSDEQRQLVREETGLDQPFLVRYGNWLGGFVTGDMGNQYTVSSTRPVVDRVTTSLWPTVLLMVYAQTLALIIAIPVGVIAAYRQDTWFDRLSNTSAFAMLAIPTFALGFVLQYYIGVKLGWADTGGYKSPTQDLAGHVRSMILPTITLAVGQIAVYMRLLRSDMIATLQQDFITMAKAKGITTKRILFRHALRPSSLTLLTVAGLNIGTLIGGALIIEVVFNIPGLGYLMGEAIATRQIVMFQSLVAIIAIFYVFVNFCVDILYTVLDPRIRHAGT
ncbi:MAG TPA: ABC transporter permease [Microthrixaceae bacterium]|nr:ABC transporter permease [Microthrixaceae bacterium]MCB9399818.1 ABC transporter permease [Microthrixaceae bacterium]MCO5305726.1 ABC transporter permease [Microthrixaceae bacterium]HMV74198.1 ABC transporter permease [Microthrixaceae bacterium]HMX06695.1 ABC transporter permease [Microthrixaceae bacterium]